MIPGLTHLCCSRLRLPQECHIPGSQSEAELAYLSAIIKRLPKTVCSDRWRSNLPYRYGWFLFANQYYWEAHEVWEAVWVRAGPNSRERFLLQGLIQLANAGLKIRQQKNAAAAKILALATHWFAAAFPPGSRETNPVQLMGIDKATANQLTDEMHY